MQANTDECIGLGPGEAYCYCWRTHKIKQVIYLVFIRFSLSVHFVCLPYLGLVCFVVSFLCLLDQEMVLSLPAYGVVGRLGFRDRVIHA